MKRRFRLEWFVFLLIGAGILFFFKLAGELTAGNLVGFDRVVAGWVVSLRTGWLNTAFNVVTNFGSMLVIILVVLGVVSGLLVRRRFLDAMFLGISVIGALVLTESLKVFYHRERPSQPWLSTAVGYSFPSGHALQTLVLYWNLAYLMVRENLKVWRSKLEFWGLLILPVVVGFSRVYLGVHFPSDVLAGWSIGVAWLGVCIVGRERYGKTGF